MARLFTHKIVSPQYIPHTLLTVTILYFAKKCEPVFGSYADVHEYTKPLHGNNTSTTPSICIRPTINFQGNHKFPNLNMGSSIYRKQYNEIPLPPQIIRLVEAVGRCNCQSRHTSFSTTMMTLLETIFGLDTMIVTTVTTGVLKEWTPRYQKLCRSGITRQFKAQNGFDILENCFC